MTNTKLWYPWKNPSLAIALQSLKITAEVAKAREKIPNCKFRMTTEGWAPVLTNISKKTPANPEEKQATSTAIRPENKIGQIYSSNWSKTFLPDTCDLIIDWDYQSNVQENSFFIPITSSELDSSTVGGIWWLDTFAFFRSDSASVAGDDTFGIWNHKIKNLKITIRRELFFQIDD